MALFFALHLLAGCGGSERKAENEVTLVLGAYTVPKDAYQKEIIPAFQEYWKEKTGQTVRFEESYEASGAQSRAIESGFEADIAALSLEADIDRLSEAGIITHNWKESPNNGFVTHSAVVIVYRPGNPKNISGWDDLKRDDVEVLYPNPKTSGGAMWDINAIYGAGLKLSEITTGKQDKAYARGFLKAIQQRVRIMDSSGRMSVTTFENGIGDALVTYENEALLRGIQGKAFPYVLPEATILIQNPVVLVDRYVEKHGTRAVAQAFLQFLFSQTAQRAFAQYGFRPVEPTVAGEFEGEYPVPKYLFTIEYLGGWGVVSKEMYGPDGVWSKIMEELSHAH
jgi:sulfate transport system substrate-binding protein